jgi:hypothetical protein
MASALEQIQSRLSDISQRTVAAHERLSVQAQRIESVSAAQAKSDALPIRTPAARRTWAASSQHSDALPKEKEHKADAKGDLAERLESLEAFVHKLSDTLDARLILMEGKIRFLETKVDSTFATR